VGASFLGIYSGAGAPVLLSGGSAPLGREAVTRRSRRTVFSIAHEEDEFLAVAAGAARPRRSGCAGCCLPAGELEIRLEYPAGRLAARLAQGRTRLFAVGGAFTAAFASLFLFYLGRMRSAALGVELAAAGERVRSLEFLSRLAAGLAHETKNPLGALRGFAELLVRGTLPEKEVRAAAARMVDETDRIVGRLEEFMVLSRPARPRMVAVPLEELLADLVGLIRLELASKNASISFSGPGLVAAADPEQARRLFMNLLVNASEAVGSGGRVEVEIVREEGRGRVEVRDDGPGVPEAIRETLFEPYVSGRPGGTGLGLAIARRIAAEHGWTLRYEPGARGGTRMVVELPCA